MLYFLGRDRNLPITVAMILEAKENLILRRETHLDQLADKLQEERVRRVIEPILSGGNEPDLIPTDDIGYVQDLGLIQTEGQLTIANPIYQEIIPKEDTQAHMDVTAEAVKAVYDARQTTQGLRMVYEPKYLRFFQARFEREEGGAGSRE